MKRIDTPRGPVYVRPGDSGGVSIGVIAMIAVAGFVFYRWLVK